MLGLERRSLTVAAVSVLLCSSLVSSLVRADSEGIIDLDDDWETGTGTAEPIQGKQTEPVKPAVSQQQQGSKTVHKAPPGLFAAFDWQSPSGKKLYTEALILAVCVLYIANIFIGSSANKKVAKAFAQAFCMEDGIFDKNFTLVGTGEEARIPLLKESASEFLLYCSGRRHCKSLMARLKLKKRSDLFSLLLNFIFPEDDKVEIEVYMKEGSMPQTVLAVATKKLMRSMLQEESGEDDIRKLARKVEISKEKIANWPSDKLVVYAEHSSVFYDLMTEQLLDQVFRRSAFEQHGQYFKYLHFTPEQSYGPQDQRRVLRFSFSLPDKENMSQLVKLISSVGVFIDLVGNYKLNADLQKRAEKLRQDLDKKDNGDKNKEREDLAEERRNAKRMDEMEKLKKMTPEQREKYQQKKEKVQQGRQQRKFMKRM